MSELQRSKNDSEVSGYRIERRHKNTEHTSHTIIMLTIEYQLKYIVTASDHKEMKLVLRTLMVEYMTIELRTEE